MFARHHFLLRRLHSLSGLVPVGLFLFFHLFTNVQLLIGDFQHEVNFIHNMPALYFIEVTLWLSIAFHAGLGLVYTFSGTKPNAIAYGYADNWRYTFQRITGIIALVFIFVHIAHFRWRWEFLGPFMAFYVQHDGVDLASASVAVTLQNVGTSIFYLVGFLSVVYHFANGLWTMALTWGVTITVGAQRRWGYVCAVIGLVLALFGLGALVGAWTYEISPEEQRAFQEARMGDTGYSPDQGDESPAH